MASGSTSNRSSVARPGKRYMVTSQAAPVPNKSDSVPTPAMRRDVSMRAPGSTVWMRWGHTLSRPERQRMAMVANGRANTTATAPTNSVHPGEGNRRRTPRGTSATRRDLSMSCVSPLMTGIGRAQWHRPSRPMSTNVQDLLQVWRAGPRSTVARGAQETGERDGSCRGKGHHVEGVDVADHRCLAFNLVRQSGEADRRLRIPQLRQTLQHEDFLER